MTLMEVLWALAIIGVMIITSATVTTQAHMMTRTNTDKEFTTQKAISILEEMKALVQSDASATDITNLDKFDDSITRNPVLTIQGTQLPPGSPKTPTLPDDPISGNTYLGNNKWLYERLISVKLVPGQANDVRLVNVKMFKNTENGALLLVAEVSSVIRTIVTSMPPSQVYDVYAIAVENVPGWWVFLSNVVPFVKNSINDLQSRNPGLVFRTHWINTLSYGRDQEYLPYVNNDVDSTQDIASVYFYPGVMPTSIPGCTDSGGAAVDCVGNNYYYPPFFFRGHVMIDKTETNGYQPATADDPGNPSPYALADQYNHSMRYPDEKALYDARKKANPDEEMTLRLLLDDMWAQPYNYTNAMVINLHGELMPFPPVRNYSDPARDPEQKSAPDLREIRVVTHPEQIRYNNGDDLRLRVYSYLTDPNINNPYLTVPISIVISNTNSWIPAAGDIQGIRGGIGINIDSTAGAPYNGAAADSYDNAPQNIQKCGSAGLPAKQMCYDASLTGPSGTDTLIYLYNSPLIHPLETNTGRGVDYGARLYGMEYIPSPVEDLSTGAVPFTLNLTSTSPMPKNTARWVIRIPNLSGGLKANSQVQIDTRIGKQETSGVLWPVRDHPRNLSRTYAWRGTTTYLDGNPAAVPPVAAALPFSERFQFQGDPRHCPYADLKRPPAVKKFPAGPAPPQGNYESPMGMGFNRFFDDFEDTIVNTNTVAELFGPWGGNSGVNYIVTAANNTFAFTIDGVATGAFTITTGTKSAATIASNLNAVAAFNARGIADGFNNRLRIRSKTSGTVQFNTASATAELLFGFDDLVRTARPWVGWNFSSGGTNYGVKNSGTLAPTAAQAADDGWSSGGGDQDVDVNRYFQWSRSALQRSNAIWTTMTGWSYYYIGIGGEIGYDQANGFQNSIPVSKMPYTGASGSWSYIDTITSGQGVYLVRNAAGTWWSMPWLGEIYPDSAYSATSGPDWLTTGNLPSDAGNPAGQYVRDLRQNFPTFPGTDFNQAVRRTSAEGVTTMFWTGATTSTFHHSGGSGTNIGTIAAAGTDIANNYSFPVPGTINSNRPFNLTDNNTGQNPDFFLEDPYFDSDLTKKSANTVNLISGLNSYYTHELSPWISSAELALADTNTWNPAFYSVNGLSPTGVSGTTFISKWSFLSLIQGYLNAGLYQDTSPSPKAHHVKQLPRLAITSPNLNTNLKNPPSISVAWTATWLRWDNIPYTTLYPGGYSETTPLDYQVMYSTSNGAPNKAAGNPTGWFFAKDDKVATPGQKDPTETVTTTSYTWNTPSAKFPEGNYLIRVEGYRQGMPLHYSFHQYRAYISR
jgi:hypothetical protein